MVLLLALENIVTRAAKQIELNFVAKCTSAQDVVEIHSLARLIKEIAIFKDFAWWLSFLIISSRYANRPLFVNLPKIRSFSRENPALNFSSLLD